MKSNKIKSWAIFLGLAAALLFPAPALADLIMERLSGFEEVPSVSTKGSGKFMAKIHPDREMIEYKLFYEDLEGDVLFAHIHVGQKGVNGPVSAFLCTNQDQVSEPIPTENPVPECPGPNRGMVTGIIAAGDVIGPDALGIAPGEFRELLQMMFAGSTYVNVHSEKFPGGELRGQLNPKKFKFRGFDKFFDFRDFDFRDFDFKDDHFKKDFGF